MSLAEYFPGLIQFCILVLNCAEAEDLTLVDLVLAVLGKFLFAEYFLRSSQKSSGIIMSTTAFSWIKLELHIQHLQTQYC